MNLIKRYGIIAAILVPVLILIVYKTFSIQNFKYDVRKWAGPSMDRSNLISIADTGSMNGEKMVIDLDLADRDGNLKTSSLIRIPPDSILSRKYFEKINDNPGPVILSSDDLSLSARIWMLLSQTGHRNIYILTVKSDDEVFKYKFRPDTTLSPEP